MEESSVTQVIEALSQDPAAVGATSLATLSDLDRQAAETVTGALRAIDFETRRVVVQRLVDLAEENLEYVFDRVFIQLLDDEDDEVREAAVKGLWECEERAIIEPLFERLLTDDHERVRAAAAQALGRFALRAELGELLERDSMRVKRGLLEIIGNEREPSFEVRRRLIEAVAPFDLEDVRELITENYESANETMRASALYAMGQNAHPSWMPYILDEMESESDEARYEAAGAAGRIGDERMIPALARMGHEENPEVQAAVVTALNAIGGPTAQRVLRRFMQHPDARMRELAVDALETMQTVEEGHEMLRSPGGGIDADGSETTGAGDDVFENYDDDLGIDEELDDDDYDDDDDYE